jgi:hypothetical protein
VKKFEHYFNFDYLKEDIKSAKASHKEVNQEKVIKLRTVVNKAIKSILTSEGK